jgi:predicted DNA-binding protein (MmcQ/YjbR family)
MGYGEARAACLVQAGADEAFPFGPEAAVFRVAGKMFAILGDDPPRISLKCEPGAAVALRAAHPSVQPGYHLNKRHWNTVTLDGTVADDLIREWIEDSYDLVVAGLPKTVRAGLTQA